MKNTLDKTKKPFLESRKPRLIPALLVALSIPFMIFIVSPLEIYKNGIDEFNFALSDFIFILLFFIFLPPDYILSVLYYLNKFFLPHPAPHFPDVVFFNSANCLTIFLKHGIASLN
mgnify:CR=1 FL=1